jgi:sugar phosphate permease
MAWLCGVTAIAYIHRSCLAIPADVISRDLGLSKTQMGDVMGGFSVVYALSQIPAGWLGDRWGSRRALPLYAGVWSLATGSIGMAVGMVSMMASQVTNGLAQAGVFPCSANTLSKWFPVSRRAFPLGLTGCFQSLGVITANNLMAAWLLAEMSWRLVFPLVSILGFVWAAGFYLWFRDRPSEHFGVNPEELKLIHEDASEGTIEEGILPQLSEKPLPTPWMEILTSPTMGLICGQQFFRAAGYVFYLTWFPTYLIETRGVELSELGFLASLPPAAFVIAGPLGGALSDWIQIRTGNRRLSRQLLACTCMMLCSLLFLAAYFIEAAYPAVLVITIGSFFAALGSPPGNVVTIDLSGRHVAAVYSTMNMAGNAGAAICPSVVGRLVDWTGNWDHVLLFFVGLYVAVSICWMFLNPNRPIFRKDAHLHTLS